MIIIAALMLIGTEAFRRQTRQEFPNAAMPEGGIREAIGGLQSRPTLADHDEPGKP